MRLEQELTTQGFSSVVFAIDNEEQANFLTQEVKSLAAFGRTVFPCKYAERPPVIQCKQCWKYGHISTACNSETQHCRLCDNNHTETQHKEGCNQCKALEVVEGMEIDSKLAPCNHNMCCRHCKYKDEFNHPSDSRCCPKHIALYGTARTNKHQPPKQAQNNQWMVVQNWQKKGGQNLQNRDTNRTNKGAQMQWQEIVKGPSVINVVRAAAQHGIQAKEATAALQDTAALFSARKALPLWMRREKLCICPTLLEVVNQW